MASLHYQITGKEWKDICHLTLSPSALKLLVLLRSLDPYGNRTLKKPTAELAEMIGTSIRTVQRALKTLTDLGLIAIEKSRDLMLKVQGSCIPKEEPKPKSSPSTSHPWREPDGALNPQFKSWLLNLYLMPIWQAKRGRHATESDVNKYVQKREGTKLQSELEQRWQEFRQSTATLPTIEHLNVPSFGPGEITLKQTIARLNAKLANPLGNYRKEVEQEIQQKWAGTLAIIEGKVCQIASEEVINYLKQNNGLTFPPPLNS